LVVLAKVAKPTHIWWGEPAPTIRNKVKFAFLLRPHKRGVQPMRLSGAHKNLGGQGTSMFKMEKGNYAQSFYCYNFIHTILCKLIG